MIVITIPGWPPSVNHMYAIVNNRKVLTTEGRSYKANVHFIMAQQLLEEFERPDPEKTYKVSYYLYREDWLNKGWPTKAKNKFKQIDWDNAIKCVQDAAMESLGMNDSQLFDVKVEKWLGKMMIRIELQPLPAITGQNLLVFPEEAGWAETEQTLKKKL
jgi:Holliday junction resolvase RusA-like endonuclease